MENIRMPYEMNDSELLEVIIATDFFGEYDSFAMMCHDELNSRENIIAENCPSLSNLFDVETAEDGFEDMREHARIRSVVFRKVGRSTAHRLKNNNSWELTEKDFSNMEKVAHWLNENSDTLTESFIKNFSTSGYFMRDDITTIVNEIESIANTEQKIRDEKAAVSAEIEEICAWFESESIQEHHEKQIVQQNKKQDSKTDYIHENCISNFPFSNENHFSQKNTVHNPIVTTILNYTFNKTKTAVLMGEMTVDKRDWNMFKDMLRKSPQQAKYAAQHTLNNMAFDLRKEYVDESKKTQVVRNKTLNRKSITYKKAALSEIDSMMAEVGSSGIANRFTGFGEQEQKKIARRKRLITKKGRGRKRSKLKEQYRMNKNHANLSKQVGRRGTETEKRALAYFARLKREGRLGSVGANEDTFIATKNHFSGKMRKGVYQFGKAASGNIARKRKNLARGRDRRIDTIQYSPESKSKLQPKPNKMLSRSAKRYFNSPEPGKRFIKNIKKQMKFVKS